METETLHDAKVNNGWILYYSEEGYPYYYNEATGESEWAQFTDENGMDYSTYNNTVIIF